jgi:hypothetical protein
VVTFHPLHKLFFAFAELTLDDPHEFLFLLHSLISKKTLVGLLLVFFVEEVGSVVDKLLQICIKILALILLIFCLVVDSFLAVVVILVVATKFCLLIEQLIDSLHCLLFSLLLLHHLHCEVL